MLLCHLIKAMGHQSIGDILLFHHETYEHILIRQFLLEAFGIETIQHIVVLHSRMRADSLEATVVVGEHQSIGRYNDTRAIAREIDNGMHNGIVGLIKLFVRQTITIALHLLIDSMGQVVKRPHALIGMGGNQRSYECNK